MKRLLTRSLFLVVIPLVGVLATAYFYYTGGRHIVTENAYVKARLINISSDVDGRVVEVPIRNNQPVTAGQLLFRIDPEPAEIELMAAQAEVENVRLRVESLKSQYRQSLLEIDDAKARIRFLESQMRRQEKLKQQGHGLEIEFDQAEHNLEMGQRGLITAYQKTDVILADLAGDPDLPIERHALFLAAQAKVDRALRALNSTRIIAPTDGVLSNVTLEAGEYLEAGDRVFSIVETGQVWVEANLKESQLTNLQVGQTATIVADAYPDLALKATVTSLSPATGSEFSILPPQNSTGNWIKVVQRIPVRLDITLTDNQPALRAGMTTTVKIDTQFQRPIPELLQPVIASIRNNYDTSE